jgi:hypothetical protein
MQAVELVGAGVDGDFDGVADELTIGDQTALAVYLAAQPRPTTLLELDSLGLLATPLTTEQKGSIQRGAGLMQGASLGCVSCHKGTLALDDPIFSEPSQSEAHRDAVFPAGPDPDALGVDPRRAVRFDRTQDQPDNRLLNPDGSLRFRLGSLRVDPTSGKAQVDLGGDLKRHDKGRGLAEPIDETGTGASVFHTENLWGVGSTAPYLHRRPGHHAHGGDPRAWRRGCGIADRLTEALVATAGRRHRAPGEPRPLQAAGGLSERVWRRGATTIGNAS